MDIISFLAAPFIASFTTVAQPITFNPSVIQLRPANGATGVPLNSKISLYLNASMDPATVAGALFISIHYLAGAGWWFWVVAVVVATVVPHAV